ncbi:extracellular solute-binding protein family 1 [Pseudodesulfovibrio mercurii]|uniref:Extracellular solute-binding protein family 1 n=1 Tax=Pseudodesulfovibrio mercurii TaxID=641491 RepID=F0JDE6_9BACT|nr:extracellular solute-binding protein [Pseudodesulfovibrio mercurii]EGB13315.1 extracellular solute-binding protein family 1 [Pseudodesulfovibrio mercurii]
METNAKLEKTLKEYESGGMTRRSFLKTMTTLGVAAAVANAVALSPLGAVKAFAAISGPEERAWALAKVAAAKATKKTLTLLIPTGSIGNMTPYADKWKNELGITLEFIEEPDEVVHTKGMQEAVAKTGRYDVMMPTAMSYPDWIDSGVIYDLTDWTEKYDPELFNKEWGVVFPASHHAQLYNGRVAGLLNDGDQITLLCRKDYLEDSDKAKAFEDKFGRKLAVPDTWKEYYDLASFMHDPAKGFYGSLEYRSPYYVKWMFMQRLVSKGMLYFDGEMNPTFNSDEGVAALEDMLAMNQFLHPDAFSFTWSSNYNAFGRGEGFMNIVWPSGFKYSMAPSTGPATTGKIAATVMPADFTKDGTKLYAGMFCWGYGYAVSKYSANPELAYAYSQWMTSPTISADAIPYLGGYSDPYRVNHMLEPTKRLVDTYTKPYLNTLYNNMVNTVPDFCLPGGFEYQDALDKEVHACMTGSKKPKEALEQAAHKFERITRRIGKDKVKKAWIALTSNLAAPIKKAAGVDNWS